MSGPSLNQVQTEPVGANGDQQPPPPVVAPSYYRPKENNPNQPVVNPLEKPTGNALCSLVAWDFWLNCLNSKFMEKCQFSLFRGYNGWVNHVVRRISYTLHVQENNARLQIRRIQKLVPFHILYLNDLDFVLFVLHGLDDNNYR